MSDSNSSIPAGSRPIPSAPGYRICDGGEVWSSHVIGHFGLVGPWHVIKPRKPSKSGHIQIDLQVDGKRIVSYVHQLVLEAFVGPCPPGMEARHFPDRNPANNFVSNLEWATHLVNMGDMEGHGTSPVGSRQGGAKLTESDIPEIFRSAAAGMGNGEIATKFGVTSPEISMILARKRWGHVEIDPILADKTNRPLGEWAFKWSAKLVDADIPEIFRLHTAGMSYARIAKRFGITKSNVGAIIRRKTWSHVTIPAEYLTSAHTT